MTRVLDHVLSSLVATFLLMCLGCAHPTPPFFDESGMPASGSIAEETYLSLSGTEEYLLVRGQSLSNPVVLFVHGGPGGSETALMRAFHAELEQSLIMAYWDQRGAGKSYHADTPPASMTISQFVQDMDMVVDYLRFRLGQDRIFLLGHSWGTSLSMLYAKQFPEKIAGYIGVGQTAGPETERHAYDFVVSEAERRGHQSALADLRRIGPPPYSEHDKIHIRDRLLHRYGGYTYAPVSLGQVIWRALWTPEAGLRDLFRTWSALHFSQAAMTSELTRFDLPRKVPALDVPVTFILGRHDHRTWAPLAERYLEQLEAPRKRLFWLEHSAHNGPFEEPEQFRRYVLEALGIATSALVQKPNRKIRDNLSEERSAKRLASAAE